MHLNNINLIELYFKLGFILSPNVRPLTYCTASILHYILLSHNPNYLKGISCPFYYCDYNE